MLQGHINLIIGAPYANFPLLGFVNLFYLPVLSLLIFS